MAAGGVPAPLLGVGGGDGFGDVPTDELVFTGGGGGIFGAIIVPRSLLGGLRNWLTVSPINWDICPTDPLGFGGGFGTTFFFEITSTEKTGSPARKNGLPVRALPCKVLVQVASASRHRSGHSDA